MGPQLQGFIVGVLFMALGPMIPLVFWVWVNERRLNRCKRPIPRQDH